MIEGIRGANSNHLKHHLKRLTDALYLPGCQFKQTPAGLAGLAPSPSGGRSKNGQPEPSEGWHGLVPNDHALTPFEARNWSQLPAKRTLRFQLQAGLAPNPAGLTSLAR
ncbi:hypothetical protein Bpro_3361 [Polaromonas sp. JS666]|nr:hypothetical protein Bpro_3361 [Polaromonas sp. JS666]